MKPFRGIAASVAILAVLTNPADAQVSYGFFNQGFTQPPVVQTDFLSHSEGTASTPLQVTGCHFGQNPCPALRTVFPQSNYWSEGIPFPCVPGFSCPGHWWTLVMNNEPKDAAGNPGPPDVSFARFWPGGGGIMGFSTLHASDNFPGDTYWRAHLVLSTYPTNPVRGALPFLGFGAFSSQGNGWPIGSLNPSSSTTPHVLKFDSRLWGSALPQPCCGVGTTQLQTITSWLQIFAKWGTHPKLIQIALWHQARDPMHPSTPDPYLGGPPPQNYGVEWDWRYLHSGFYPGAVLLSVTAEEINGYCGFSIPTLILNQDVHYSIDMQSLFQCMNNHHLFDEPMPTTTNIPITSVFWSNEASGINGYLWTDVHNMRMVGTSGTLADGEVNGETDSKLLGRGSGEQYGAETELIRQAFLNDVSLSH